MASPFSLKDSGTPTPPPATRNADADADFADALIGFLVNARLAAFDRYGTGAQRRVDCGVPTTLTAQLASGTVGLTTNAVAFGRDLSDATLRAIEARTGTGWNTSAQTLYLLGCAAQTYALDIAGSTMARVGCDIPSNIVNGNQADNFRGLWVNALDSKYDVAAATPVVTPTAMVRTAQGSAVNPAAAVIATLDARGLTNKSFGVTDTASAGTYSLELSYDGTTYLAPAEFALIAIGIATVMASNRAIEAMKGFRFVRIKATQPAGTVTVQMSAQGA